MSCRREALFESCVNMLHQHCDEAPGTYSVLHEVLQRAIKEFPNNMYLLTTAAKLQVSTVLFIAHSLKNKFIYNTHVIEGHSYHHHHHPILSSFHTFSSSFDVFPYIMHLPQLVSPCFIHPVKSPFVLTVSTLFGCHLFFKTCHFFPFQFLLFWK
jgi:hypothetical protein